jgi:hypothetical protein
MGQTLSEPVVEKVRVCALYYYVANLVLGFFPGLPLNTPKFTL